jgi:hypothetical protein
LAPRGQRRTGRVRTAVDLIRRGAVDDGVVLLDRLVTIGIVALADVRAAVDVLPRGRGTRQAREVSALADGLAASPQETRVPCQRRLIEAATGPRWSWVASRG